MGFRGIKESFSRPFEIGEIIHQIYEIGWCSGPLVIASGFAFGVVLALMTNLADDTEAIKHNFFLRDRGSWTFYSASDGAQELSKDGPAILDQNMSQLVSHLSHNPVMIEGYSESTTLDQQYLISRQRAAEVRQYLESHCHLNPKLVGI